VLFGRPLEDVEPALVAALEADREARAGEPSAASIEDDGHRREVAAMSSGGVSRRMTRAVLARLRRLTR
jgi:hypothetical protein